MNQRTNKKTLQVILKKIGKSILIAFITFVLSSLCNYIGIKLDEKFVFQKCLECSAKFLFIFNYAFLFLCFILFLFFVVLVIRHRLQKFWILNGLMICLIAGINLFDTFVFTLSLVKFPDTMPVVSKVFPEDRQFVFYEDEVTDDKKEKLTGFVLQKDNPIPIRYENGKIKEYDTGNKWYLSNDVEYSKDKMEAFYKVTHEPITGFIVHIGENISSVLEYQNGKIGKNRFSFSSKGNIRWLANWVYSLKGHIHSYQQYYPNGFLKTSSGFDNKGKFTFSGYNPNGQLISKIYNGSENSLSEVDSLQKLLYNSNGQLVIYWDMRSGKAFCVYADSTIRRMTPREIQRVFDEEEKFTFINGEKIPEFRCE